MAKPDPFDDEEIEGGDEPPASRGWLRIFLLGILFLAAAGIALFYLSNWWSGSLAPPAPPPVAKTKPSAPPAPSAPEMARAPARSAPAPAPAEPIPALTPAPAKGEFWVQVGAFADPKNAQRLGDRLIADRYPVAIRPGESQPTLVTVLVGAYQDRRQAEAARAELEKKGVTGFVLRRAPGR